MTFTLSLRPAQTKMNKCALKNVRNVQYTWLKRRPSGRCAIAESLHRTTKCLSRTRARKKRRVGSCAMRSIRNSSTRSKYLRMSMSSLPCGVRMRVSAFFLAALEKLADMYILRAYMLLISKICACLRYCMRMKMQTYVHIRTVLPRIFHTHTHTHTHTFDCRQAQLYDFGFWSGE